MRIVIFLLIIVSGLLSTSAQTEPLRDNDTTSVTQLTEVVVVANPVSEVRNSAFSRVAEFLFVYEVKMGVFGGFGCLWLFFSKKIIIFVENLRIWQQ